MTPITIINPQNESETLVILTDIPKKTQISSLFFFLFYRRFIVLLFFNKEKSFSK